MGLSRLLARAAAQRLHVLLVEGDDAFVLRAAAERACLARGWVLALSPADADVMLACRPRPAVVSEVVDAVFAQLPGPRARADLWHERHLEAVLDQLHASYLAWPSAPTAGRSADTSPEAGDRHRPGTAQHPTVPPGHESHGHTPGHHDRPAPSEHSHPSEQHPQAAVGQRHSATPEPRVGPVHSPHAQSPEHAEHAEHGMQDAEKQEHDNASQDMHPGHGEMSPHDTHSGHGDDSGQDTHSSRHDDSGQDEDSEQEAHSGDDDAEIDDPEKTDAMHEAHSGHDMQSGHDMNMAGPGGVALASGAPDRDGLEMDRLHVQLGPVLASWPAGLVVWCTLAGDVVTQVDVVQPAFAQPRWAGRDLLVAVRLDAAAQLLGLAGADAAAHQVRAARDTVLVRGRRTATALHMVDGLPRSVERTPLLRWSLRGLGIVSASAAVEHGWPQDWVGDVHSRLLRLLDPLAPLEAGLVEGGLVAGALPVLLNGLDVAAARLVVASLVAQTANPAADRVAAPLRAAR